MPLTKFARPSTRLVGTLLVSACLILPATAQTASPPDKAAPIDPGPVAKPASPDANGAKTSDQSGTSDGQKSGQSADRGGKDSSSSEGGGKAASSGMPQDPRMADAEAFYSARLAALHAGLTLTADQEPLWAPVEEAIRDLRKSKRMRNREQLMDLLKETPSDLLRMRSEQLVERGNAMKKLVDATRPLLEKLDDMQKRRLPMLIVGMRPERILRAAFDIRYGRVMNDPDDEASPRVSKGDERGPGGGHDEADRDEDAGMGHHHRRMHDEGYERGRNYGDDEQEGASYDTGHDNPHAMPGRRADPADD